MHKEGSVRSGIFLNQNYLPSYSGARNFYDRDNLTDAYWRRAVPLGPGKKRYGSLPFFCEVILNKKDHMQLNIFPPKLLWFPSHIHLLQNFVKITIDKWLTLQFSKGCSNAVFLKTNVKDRHRKTIEALQQIHTPMWNACEFLIIRHMWPTLNMRRLVKCQ